MKKEIDIALDAQKKLLLRLIEKPKEFENLPKKGFLLPKERVIVPFEKVKTVGEFLVLPKKYSLEKLKRELVSKN